MGTQAALERLERQLAAAIRHWFVSVLAADILAGNAMAIASNVERNLGKGILDEGWWATVLIGLRNILRKGIIAAAQQGARGAERQLGVSLDWNMLLPQTLAWAEAHAGELVQRVGDDVKQTVKRAVVDGLAQGWDVRRIAERIQAETGLTDWRAERIARTEIIAAHAHGARVSYEASGTVRGLRWLDGQAFACSLCRQLHNQVRRLDEPFYMGRFGDGLPPRHPNCRCAVSPVTLDEVKRLPADHPLRDNRRASVAELTDKGLVAWLPTKIHNISIVVTGERKRHFLYKHPELQYQISAGLLERMALQPAFVISDTRRAGDLVYYYEESGNWYRAVLARPQFQWQGYSMVHFRRAGMAEVQEARKKAL